MLQWYMGEWVSAEEALHRLKEGGRYISALHKVGGLSRLSELFTRGILLLN